MKSIIVKDSFYESSIVQGLRMLYSQPFVFIKSSEVLSDLFFPFCGNMAFTIFYPDQLNKEGIKRIDEISQVNSNLTVIVCISREDAKLYEHFLCDIPTIITAVVCFPYENFQKVAATFIYEMVNDFKLKTRELENILKRYKKQEVDNQKSYPILPIQENCDENISFLKHEKSAIKTIKEDE